MDSNADGFIVFTFLHTERCTIKRAMEVIVAQISRVSAFGAINITIDLHHTHIVRHINNTRHYCRNAIFICV